MAVGAGVAWLVVRVGLGSSHPVAMESEGAGERRPPGVVVVRGCKGMAPLAATVVSLRDGAQRTGVSSGGVWWLVANQCGRCDCSAMDEIDASCCSARPNGSKIFYVLSCLVPLKQNPFPCAFR